MTLKTELYTCRFIIPRISSLYVVVLLFIRQDGSGNKQNVDVKRCNHFFPVLLYPADKPHTDIRRKIRPPDMVELLSSHFADPPKRPRTPIEVKHKDKVRRSKSGKLLIDTRHQYPTNASVAPYGFKMNLSTGRAVVKRKVDCWMTFEEYEALTK